MLLWHRRTLFCSLCGCEALKTFSFAFYMMLFGVFFNSVNVQCYHQNKIVYKLCTFKVVKDDSVGHKTGLNER